MVLYFKNDKKNFFPNFSNVCIYYKYINYRLIVTNFVLVAIKKKKKIILDPYSSPTICVEYKTR